MFHNVLRPTRVLVILCHVATAALSVMTAFLLRFDFSVPEGESNHVRMAICLAIVIKVLCFQTTSLRGGWWRFAGLGDIYLLGITNTIASILFTVITRLVVGPTFPRSIYVLDFLLSFLLTCQMRFAGRVSREVRASLHSKTGAKGVLIYGAGAAGVTLVREIRSNPSLKIRVLGFLDDDPKKRRESVLGFPILGTGRDARTVAAKLGRRNLKADEVIIAIPSATAKQMREAVANCRAAGLPCKTVPGIGDVLKNKVLSRQIREVSITDLLGREAVQLEEPAVRKHIASKNVLVTGGAGSIGSELCRQIVALGARRAVIFDRAESDLYRIEVELRRLAPATEIVIEIGDIRDYQRVEEVMTRHAIQLIFHAAAYKHVPLMENHLFEAVTNNVYGTWNVLRAAHRVSASGFVMISSDKAVNPSSVMGLTKRVSELIVSAFGREDGTCGNYVSVRFGNVLGSNGSVIPLFQAQIERGGPVTVTHPEMRRYFMTTREAVQLVLQASTMGNSSEVFVLDMGEPVRIIDLARNMIRLTGLEPDEDIDIRIVGVRPGEKLFEELLLDSDRVVPTRHDKIKISRGTKVSRGEILAWLTNMEVAIAERDASAVMGQLCALVPEYVGVHAFASSYARRTRALEGAVATFAQAGE